MKPSIEDKVTQMPTENTRKAWSNSVEVALKKFTEQKTPTGVIGLRFGRSGDEARNQAREFGVSLKPMNQSSYNK